MPSVINGSDNFNSAAGAGLKAWVNFNGAGTVAIRKSYYVSSITDNGSGDYTVNFTGSMLDANYSVQLTATNYNSGQGNIPTIRYLNGSYNGGTTPTLKTTSAFRFVNGIGNSTQFNDCSEFNALILN